MAASQDTEITLGTGKMLTLFFGLVVLCAVFFGMGFSLGRSSVKPLSGDLSSQPAPARESARPSAVKPASASPSNLTFYKAVERKDSDTPATPADTTDSTAESAPPVPESKPAAPDPVQPPSNGYFVQVAAVSKQEDAQALVDALKKKQYAAFTVNGAGDKLFHVQVGPFSDIKDAELTRSRLVGDGYNPILKK
ncbi:MAG TPA: SPOR domain-containing protein [Terriglobales bacterium]|nr:SPOR domain-containing protein [Terriglobales bacterium]